jgi:hypothetical protein
VPPPLSRPIPPSTLLATVDRLKEEEEEEE